MDDPKGKVYPAFCSAWTSKASVIPGTAIVPSAPPVYSGMKLKILFDIIINLLPGQSRNNIVDRQHYSILNI
jgi:hypothetical protein